MPPTGASKTGSGFKTALLDPPGACVHIIRSLKEPLVVHSTTGPKALQQSGLRAKLKSKRLRGHEVKKRVKKRLPG